MERGRREKGREGGREGEKMTRLLHLSSVSQTRVYSLLMRANKLKTAAQGMLACLAQSRNSSCGKYIQACKI